MKKLVKIHLPEKYYKKWNEVSRDFYTFTDSDVNDIVVSDLNEVKNYTLYRIGGLYDYNTNNEFNIILKYKEDFFPDHITKDLKRKPHLSPKWVAVDKNGSIVYESSKSLHSLYLIGNCIISEQYVGYYNLITKQSYSSSYNQIFETKENIILYSHKEKAIIINKNTGHETVIL